MSNLSTRALALSDAYGSPDPGIDWERMVRVVDRAVEISQPAWQPIETAPKDRAHILYFPPLKNLGAMVKIDRIGLIPRKPTHWMPLPAPPADREKTEGEAGV